MDKKNISVRKILHYFWLIVKNYQFAFWSIFFIWAIARGAQSIVVPLYYKKIVDIISTADNVTVAAPLLFKTFTIFAFLIVFYEGIYRLGEYIMATFQAKAFRDFYNFTFKKLQDHSYQFFTNSFVGGLVAKVGRYVRAFENIHDTFVYSFLTVSIQLIGSFIVLLSINSLLGLLFLAWTIVYVFIAYILSKKRMKYDMDAATADSEATGYLSDAISNILNIKIFSSGEYEQKEHEGIREHQRKTLLKSLFFNNGISAIQATMLIILQVGGLYVAIQLWIAGTVTAGTVVLVQTYITMLFGFLWGLGKAMSRFATALANAKEMIDIFEIKPDVLDPIHPQSFQVTEGVIEFKGVSFSYNQKTEVLKNFSLTIPKGQKVGLVGESGAGKTTITKLLLRFADVAEGEILIDGQNIAHVRQDDVRHAISYVPQDPLLFHRSLRENIAYGKPHARDEEIVEVAQKARAHDFITETPEGYQTLVGERGIKLSGGERQRVAIARAMLENAPILVLDEATSSLDSVSEHAIQEAFEELLKGKTAIVIAHRLSTIRKLDRIIVMDHGKIVEDGTHEELLNKEGYYYNLWSHQQGGFLADKEGVY